MKSPGSACRRRSCAGSLALLVVSICSQANGEDAHSSPPIGVSSTSSIGKRVYRDGDIVSAAPRGAVVQVAGSQLCEESRSYRLSPAAVFHFRHDSNSLLPQLRHSAVAPSGQEIPRTADGKTSSQNDPRVCRAVATDDAETTRSSDAASAATRRPAVQVTGSQLRTDERAYRFSPAAVFHFRDDSGSYLTLLRRSTVSPTVRESAPPVAAKSPPRIDTSVCRAVVTDEAETTRSSDAPKEDPAVRREVRAEATPPHDGGDEDSVSRQDSEAASAATKAQTVHRSATMLSPATVFYFKNCYYPKPDDSASPESESSKCSDAAADPLPALGNSLSVDESTLHRIADTTSQPVKIEQEATTELREIAEKRTTLRIAAEAEVAPDTDKDAGSTAPAVNAPARLIVGDTKSVASSEAGEQVEIENEDRPVRLAEVEDSDADSDENASPKTVGFESANHIRAAYGKLSRTGRRLIGRPRKFDEDSEEFCVLFEIEGKHVVRQYIDVDYDGVIDYSRTIYNDCHEVWRDIRDFSPKPSPGSSQYMQQHPGRMTHPQLPAAPPSVVEPRLP